MRREQESDLIEVPPHILHKWQALVDVMAELAAIPAGLIMRVVDEDIEVFIASRTEGNPYQPGDKEHLVGSGLYCEHVMNARQKLLVPNALKDEEWKDNPDIKLNLISYLGFPILLPNGKPFGTICVLDSKENAFSESIEALMNAFRDLVQLHLELLFMNQILGDRNKHLTDYLGELQSLRGLIPICSRCKKIKNSEGYWKSVEHYLCGHPEADFTHGYCPECLEMAKAELADRNCDAER